MRADGETVAVLAVDPSSPFTGGAILGDRVRMGDHALDDGVFIRSMATAGHLGGLSLAVPGGGPGARRRGLPVGAASRRSASARSRSRSPARPTPPSWSSTRVGRRRAGQQGGAHGDRRRLRGQQGRPARARPTRCPTSSGCSRCASGRAAGARRSWPRWRRPVTGVDELWGAMRDHAAWARGSGELDAAVGRDRGRAAPHPHRPAAAAGHRAGRGPRLRRRPRRGARSPPRPLVGRRHPPRLSDRRSGLTCRFLAPSPPRSFPRSGALTRDPASSLHGREGGRARRRVEQGGAGGGCGWGPTRPPRRSSDRHRHPLPPSEPPDRSASARSWPSPAPPT